MRSRQLILVVLPCLFLFFFFLYFFFVLFNVRVTSITHGDHDQTPIKRKQFSLLIGILTLPDKYERSLFLSCFSLVGRDGHGDHLPPVFGSLALCWQWWWLNVMIQHECQNLNVWFFSWKMHSQIRLFWKLIILLTVFPIHQNFK
jgi:hypothetical protein